MKRKGSFALAVWLAGMSMAACNTVSVGTTAETWDGESFAAETAEVWDEESFAVEISDTEEGTEGQENIFAEYVQKEYDNGAVSLKPVAGMLYLPVETGIQMYYQGLLAGYMIAWETDAEEDSLEALLYQWEIAQGTRAWCEVLAAEQPWTAEGSVQYHRVIIKEQISAFSYGDTEYLVDQQVFDSVEEATDQFSTQYCLFLVQPGQPYGYSVFLNGLIVSEAKRDELYDAIQLSETAFAGQVSFGGIASETVVFGEEGGNLLDTIAYASDCSLLRHQFELGEIEIQMPEGTIAVQTGENRWKLYQYNTYYPEAMGEVFLWDCLPDQIEEPFIRSLMEERNAAIDGGRGEPGTNPYEWIVLKAVFEEEDIRIMEDRGIELEKADKERAERVRLVWNEETNQTICVIERIFWNTSIP